MAAMQNHFRSGVKLLSQLQDYNHHSTVGSNKVLVKHELALFDDYLVDVFTRLNLQFTMLGHGSQLKQTFMPLFQINQRIHIPSRFCSVSEARQSLLTILIAIIYIERHTISTNTTISLEKQKALEGALSIWTLSLEKFMTSLLDSPSQHDRTCLLMLQNYADVAKIMLATCFSTKETAYDEHILVFEAILGRYKDLLPSNISVSECAPNPRNTCDHTIPSFSIDTAFFPPLSFTALKCRNHSMRLKALSLLREMQHMEGPWTGPMLARVVGHIVDLEETHFRAALTSYDAAIEAQSHKNCLENPLHPFSVVLPEFCRIHCFSCELPSRRGQDSNIARLKLARFRHELGKDGDWYVTECDVDLYCDGELEE